MSEQAAGPASGEQGSLDLGISHAKDASGTPAAASTAETSAATAAPVSEPVVPESSKSEPLLADPVATDSPKVEAVKAEAKSVEASAPASEPQATASKVSQLPGKVIVMSRGDRAWTDSGSRSAPEADEQAGVFGKRRIAAIAAVLALAAASGAVGGALATASFMHGSNDVAMHASQGNSQTASLEASLSRIDSDIQALKAGLDHTSKLGMNQFNRTTDRLDKLERAQAEPAAKLAKLSEAIDRLHALPGLAPAAAAPAASSVSKETTGSIPSAPAQQQVAAASAAPKSDGKTDLKADMKSEVGRLPTLDDWVLRDVAYGSALIGGRRGTYEVYAGDVIPGLGRVDAIRRQDGRWVVVTSRGLIVAR
jgi:hypothetical protein